MRRKALRYCWLVALALLALAVPLVYAVGAFDGGGQSVVRDVLFLLTSGAAALSCLFAARRHGPDGRPWAWFAGGCAAWFAGSVAWMLYGLIGSGPPPYPSLADIGYLALFPCFFAGLLVIVRGIFSGPPPREIVVDALIVAIVLAGVLVEIMLLPALSMSTPNYPQLATSIVWQAGTFGIAFLTILCLTGRSASVQRAPMVALFLGVLALSLGNVIYARIALTGSYYDGHPLDLTWHAAFIFVAAGAFLSSRADESTRVRRSEGGYNLDSISRGLVTTVGAFGLTGMAVYAALHDQRHLGLAIVTGIVGVVLAARLGYATILGDRLNRRTRERDRLAAVVSASTVIAGSMSTAELLDRLVESAAQAVGRSRAELYVYSPDGSRVEKSAYSGFAPEDLETIRSLGEYDIGVFPAELRAIATQAPTIEWLDEPGLAPEVVERLRSMGKIQTLVTPMLAHGEVVGLFATWSPHDTSPFEADDIDAASVVSKQAGLAIHNARLLADARRRADEQAALLRVSEASVSSDDMREVLRRIAKASLGIAGAECCGVDLWLPESNQIEVISEETIEEWPGVVDPGTRYELADRPAMRQVFIDRTALILSADDTDLPAATRNWLFSEETASVLMYPLVIGDECLGALNMYSRTPRAFSTSDLQLAREIAGKVALGVQSARLFASTRRYAEEQAALLRVSQAVVSGQDLPATLHEVARATVGVAGAEACEIELYDQATGVVEQVAQYVADGWDLSAVIGTVATYPLDEWPSSARVIEQKSPASFSAADVDLPATEREWMESGGIRNVLIVPLLIGEHALGMLSVYSRSDRPFPADMTRFARDLAAQAALAIDRDRLNSALLERADTDGLTGVLNHRAILEALDATVNRARGRAAQFSILLIDVDNFKLFNDTHGHQVGDQVLRHATEILLGSVRESDEVGRYGGDEFLVVLDGAGMREAELVAGRLLRSAEETSVSIGGLQLPLKFSVGIAVYPEHAEMRQDLIAFADGGLYAAKEAGGGQARTTGRDSENREPTTFGTLMGLVRAVDRKDRYTKMHSDLVTEIAVRFGQALALEPEQLEALAIAGQLHDVGKIAVPDSILRKPGRLTPEESQILRQHVVFSELMVKGVPHLASVSAAIAAHHERWDGEGYPHGVIADHIPLLGRIMALADTWSAMIHDRPYRKRLAHAEAVEQIREGAGHQFDPALVERFIAVVDRMESERMSQLRDEIPDIEADLVAS